MTQKKSGLVKNLVLLLIVVACGLGAWYFVTQKTGGGAMNEAAAQEWFESGAMAQEQIDLEGVKVKLRHDSPQDMGEGRYRFDMARVNPKNTLVVDVVIRGGRAISHTVVSEAQ